MLHLESRIAPYVHDFHLMHAQNISVVAYRSLAVSRPTDAEMQQLLQDSQNRNRAEGLTGVLVYERGAYFQWLEGPTEALDRVWNSILRDPRHHRIDVLRDEPIGQRVFEGWDLRIAQGAHVTIDAAIAAMDDSNDLLRQFVRQPGSISDLSWDDLFATIVIPRLRSVHGRDGRPYVQNKSTPSIWHAELDSGARLAHVLIAPDHEESTRFVDSLLDQGADLAALYQEVFEPAQLLLGKLWDEDRCDEFRLNIGLARMQSQLRRVNAALPAQHVCRPGHSVLLSSQPSESHRVGLIMSSEIFDRHGWDVMCEAPFNDQNLGDLVHAQWFDVLKLSQSGCVRRDGRLAAMRATVDSARAASLNPALIIMVDGRTFAERPQTYRAVHANAMSASILEALPVAEQLLTAIRSQSADCEVSTA
jgi:hypothetical protein